MAVYGNTSQSFIPDNKTLKTLSSGVAEANLDGASIYYNSALGAITAAVGTFTIVFKKNNKVGMAPILSATYGAYDSGAQVFDFYQSFGGLSALPAGWTQVSGAAATYQTQTTTVGTTTLASEIAGTLPSVMQTNTGINAYYGSIQVNTSGTGFGVGLSASTVAWAAPAQAILTNTGQSNANWEILTNQTETTTSTANDGSVHRLLVSAATTASQSLYIDSYTSSLINTTTTQATGTFLDYLLAANAANQQLVVYWVWAHHVAPPANIFPTVTAGTTAGIAGTASIYNSFIFVTHTLANTQSIATSANLVTPLTFNPSLFTSYENSDLSNIFFTSDAAGQNILPSWIESGNSTSTAALVWLNLGSNTIAATTGTMNVYMWFA